MALTQKRAKDADVPGINVSGEQEKARGGYMTRKLGPDDYGLWDILLASAPDATPFASTQYLQAFSRALGRFLVLYVASRGDEVCGGIALCGRVHLGITMAPSMPVTAYSAVLYSGSASTSSYPAKIASDRVAISKSLICAVRKDFRSVDLSLVPGIDDVRPWIWNGWKAEPSFTYLLDLIGEFRPNYSVHKNARKCERSGARVSGEWQLETCWSLIEKTYERQRVGIGLDHTQFVAVAQELHECGLAWMVTVYDAEDQPAATRIQLGLPGSDTAYDWIAGTSPTAFAIGASPWNMLKVIDECRGRGYARWNMCGANYESIAKFKSEFGGTLVHGFTLHSPRPLLHSIVTKARLKAFALRQQMRHRKRAASHTAA